MLKTVYTHVREEVIPRQPQIDSHQLLQFVLISNEHMGKFNGNRVNPVK